MHLDGRQLEIHFVCTGNVYRSRLAEAYCASKRLPGIRVSSSGIAAGSNGDAPISPYAAEVLVQHSLDSWAAPHWQRTTSALVHASDVLVFMESVHKHFCEAWIESVRHRVEVWEVADIGPMELAQIPAEVQRTFAIIRQQTDKLLITLALRIGQE